MFSRKTLLGSATALTALSLALPLQAAEPIKAVATFAILGDMVQWSGGDHIALTFLAPQGLSTEAEASAQDVAHLLDRMRGQGVSAVFVENITDPCLLKQIAPETGATIGGTLYPGALSGPDGPASIYPDIMRHNATTLTQALGS